MSYLEYTVKHVPTGFAKILHLNWPLTILLAAVSGVGFLMLYSVAGGSFTPWAEPQMKRFALGIALMIAAGMVPIWLWRNLAGVAYFGTVILLIGVELFGAVGMGAQRWIEIGSFRLQPSELMKITLVMMLAAYYDWLPPKKTSRPLWVLLPVLLILIPTALVLKQPDLGTAILLMAAGGGLMFLAGVHWGYFAVVITGAVGLVTAVFQSRGTPWQLIKDYQFRRIDTFIDPSTDPLGAGYHITQSKIALGSGGWTGRGFMQGTQSRLNFLPEKHTDFIFCVLSEEHGFLGGLATLGLFAILLISILQSSFLAKDLPGALLGVGVFSMILFHVFINIGMVSGLLPIVGAPLPLVSYGGSSNLAMMVALGWASSVYYRKDIF